MNKITPLKKQLLNALMLLLFSFSFSQTLDQFNTPESFSGGSFQLSATSNVGQSFISGLTGDLSQVNIRVGDFTGSFSAGNFQLRILNGNGYSGTVLNTTIFTVNTIPELYSYAEITIPLSNVVPITAGNSYTIDVRGITGSVQTHGTGQGYSNGGLYFNDGMNFFYGTNDLWFKTFVITPPAGASLNFDGVDDYVSCGALLTPSYTKEAWIFPTNSSLQNNIISGGLDGQHAFWIPNTGGSRLSAGHNGVWFAVQDPTPLVFDTWYHVAVTYDAPTNTMKLYKNGTLVATNTNVSPVTGGSTVRIGAFSNAANLFAGNMDEVRIWNRALSACEIDFNRNTELANGQTDLVAYYKCNQGIANADNSGEIDFVDSSVNGNDGVITNFQMNGTTSNFVTPGSSANGVSGTLYNSLSVNTTQDFCFAAQVSDLVATGTGTINWYDVSTGGTALNSAQSLATNTYYVSQTTGTCESERKAVNVIIDILSAPTANANQTYEANTTVANLVATGTNLKWYALATGGTELIASTPLTTTTYYVSQSNNGCESARTAVNVTVNGGSLHFDDTNDRVIFNTAINSAIDPINTFTVETWVYNTAFDNGLGNNVGMIIGNYNTSVVDMQFMLRREGTNYQFWVNDSNSTNYKAVTAVNVAVLNQWQHVAGVWNGSDLKIYINGSLVATTTGVIGASFKSQLTNPVQLGTNFSNEKFIGNIDEVRLWTRVLSAAEIMNNMNCELGNTQTGLLAYYKFNQGVANVNNSGLTSLLDSSGNNYNGALNNFALNGTISNWSNIAAVTSGNTCTPFLSSASFDSSNFTFYPNPTSDELHLSNKKEITEVIVYNLLGQSVLNQKFNASEVSINFSELPTNTYLIKVVCGEESNIIKVVKK